MGVGGSLGIPTGLGLLVWVSGLVLVSFFFFFFSFHRKLPEHNTQHLVTYWYTKARKIWKDYQMPIHLICLYSQEPFLMQPMKSFEIPNPKCQNTIIFL
jgi:hypothetical protein